MHLSTKTFGKIYRFYFRILRVKTADILTMAEKNRYSDAELLEFEQIIDQKLNKATEELNYYLNQIQELADNDETKIKGLDDGTGTVESARLQTMASRQRKHIQHLNNAKMRVINKVYGVCRESGKLISKERLKAVPHATLSIEAKKKKP